MNELTNYAVCNVSISLGLAVSICTPEGAEVGQLRAWGTPESRPVDLRSRPGTDISTVVVEALTPDGQAFLDLMAE